jgi:hypothetical protein
LLTRIRVATAILPFLNALDCGTLNLRQLKQSRSVPVLCSVYQGREAEGELNALPHVNRCLKFDRVGAEFEKEFIKEQTEGGLERLGQPKL